MKGFKTDTHHSANIFEYPKDTSDTGDMKYIGI